MTRSNRAGICGVPLALDRLRGGAYRTVSPEATLARALPLAPRIGLTRVAVLTGLDRIGIPVAAAYRPNSRSIAVHQGKGITLAAAKASAVMEALETHHAENLRLPLRFATFGEMSALGPALDPNRLPRARGTGAPGNGASTAGAAADRLLWVEGRDLRSGKPQGEPLWVPHELVSADYTAGAADSRVCFQATTNGLATGNCWLEAILHALYEVVERDAVTLWHALADDAQQERAIDPATVGDPISAGLLTLFEHARVTVRMWDVTSDIGLAAYLCLAFTADGSDRVQAEFGSGCHADRDIALCRALTEAAQARLTVISGARDDIVPAGYATGRIDQQHAAARRLVRQPASRPFDATRSAAHVSLQADLDAAIGHLARAGLHQIAWADLSHAEIGIPVVRVVVPGLEGPWTGSDGEYSPGQRARTAAAPTP